MDASTTNLGVSLLDVKGGAGLPVEAAEKGEFAEEESRRSQMPCLKTLFTSSSRVHKKMVIEEVAS
jgi:hypothetical protein